MARGIWRQWKEEAGQDIWSARVEVASGKWTDVQLDDYSAAGHQPPFWDLPLKQEHVETTLAELLEHNAVSKLRQQIFANVVLPGIIVLILAGGLVFVFGVVVLAISSRV